MHPSTLHFLPGCLLFLVAHSHGFEIYRAQMDSETYVELSTQVSRLENATNPEKVISSEMRKKHMLLALNSMYDILQKNTGVLRNLHLYSSFVSEWRILQKLANSSKDPAVLKALHSKSLRMKTDLEQLR